MADRRARLIELTRYSKPWRDEWLQQYDGVIQRVGSGLWSNVADYKDYKYDYFHPYVMQFPVRIAYHFLRRYKPWKDQINQCLEVAKDDFHVYAVDLEKNAGDDWIMDKAFVAMQIEAMLYLQEQTKKKSLGYSNMDVVQNYIEAFDSDRFNKLDFWYSWPADGLDPRPDLDTFVPPTPKGRPWDTITLWQDRFGEHDETGCEGDVFNGTVPQLLDYANVGNVPPIVVPPTGDKPMYNGSIITSKLNVRKSPSATSEDVGDLFQGGAVAGDFLTSSGGHTWLHLTAPLSLAGNFVACGSAENVYDWIKISEAESIPVPPSSSDIFAEYHVTVYNDKSAKIELLP